MKITTSSRKIKPLTKLQKDALVYFVEKQGETPKNYANSLHSLRSNGFLTMSKNGEKVWSGFYLTNKGNTLYYSL